MTAGAGIADLLELEEANLFRVRTDRNAARVVGDLSRDVTGLVAAGEDHTELLSVGEDLAGKIREIVTTGRCALLSELHKHAPPVLHPRMDRADLSRMAETAEELRFKGRRALVDASFRQEASRHLFLESASRWGVPGLLLLCQARPAVVRARLERRQGDASDADWSIYRQAANRWEELGPPTRRAARGIDAGKSAEAALSRALDALRESGLTNSVAAGEGAARE